MAMRFYDAMDEDNIGHLYIENVLQFVRAFLRGNEGEKICTDFEEDHAKLLRDFKNDNEDGECSFDDLRKFLYQLLKDQVMYLQQRVEQDTFNRSQEK